MLCSYSKVKPGEIGGGNVVLGFSFFFPTQKVGAD